MIYLASPYSSPNPDVRSRRFIYTREFVWHHLQLGIELMSPIVYCHQFARDFGAPIDAVSWQLLNESLYAACSEMWVLCLAGWDTSTGVAMEIDWAHRDSKPLVMKEPLPYAAL